MFVEAVIRSFLLTFALTFRSPSLLVSCFIADLAVFFTFDEPWDNFSSVTKPTEEVCPTLF